MARYAILTSEYAENGHIPTVVVEMDAQNATVTYSGNRELMVEEWEEGVPKTLPFDLRLYGNSLQYVEVGEYVGRAKFRVDEILRTGRLPEEEERRIINAFEEYKKENG